MSTALDLVMVQMAIDVLAKFGTTATLHSVTPAAYDGFTNTERPETSVDHLVKAAPPDRFIVGKGPGGAVLSQSLQTIVSTQKTDGSALPEPKSGDRMTIASKTYRVADVRPLVSGDDVAAYVLEIESK